MRIISGKYKHIKFNPPKNLPVRPTTDKTKESVFNMLGSYVDFEAARALDLFAGTGSMSFEFLSRQCSHVTAVEQNPRAISYMRSLARDYSIKNFSAFKADVHRFIERSNDSYDIIFADPPYDMQAIDRLPQLILDNNLLSDEGWMLIEHSRDYNLSPVDYFHEERKYGRTRISVFRK